MISKKTFFNNRTKFLLVFTLTVFLLAGLRALFGFPIAPIQPASAKQMMVKQKAKKQSVIKETPSSPSNYTYKHTHLPSFRGDWGEAFADSQAVQLASAEVNGIRPVEGREELRKLVEQHQLLDISQSPLYYVDDLTHSVPYLVPKAQELLNDIAANFLDSLKTQGLPPHLLIVSSVLRTDDDVNRLQRGNKNATENSCHRYGTTIDITYRRFIPLTGSSGVEATLQDERLKLALGEVLHDLRNQGRCYVKYERRQACFHLTVR